MSELKGYDLSKQWFDFTRSNPEKIRPHHTALYFYCIDQCNRLGWAEKFGLPTDLTQKTTGISDYRMYVRTLNELIEWGFLELLQKSTNQYTCNIIALVKNVKATSKASPKHPQSITVISKPVLNNTNNTGTKTKNENTNHPLVNYFGYEVGIKMPPEITDPDQQ